MNSQKPLLINARFLSQKISGVQRFGIEISNILKTLYPDCIFLSPKDPIPLELANKFEPKVFGRSSGHFWEQFELPIYIKMHYPGSILLNLCNSGPLLIKNQFVTVHDVSFAVNKKWFSFTFGTWYRFLIPKIAQNSLGIFTVSNFSKKEIIKIFKIKNPSKIKVIYNATASIFVQESSLLKENYILSVASIDPRKNLETLIDAFIIVRKENPDVKLILAGSMHRAFNSQLTSAFNSYEENNIHFTGYISDEELAKLYKNAKLFVYLSLYEGFGIPPLEAMSSGCSALISDIESLREIFNSHSNYCNHLDPRDVAAKIIERLQTTPSISEINSNKAYASKFSWEVSAKSIGETLNQYIR